MSLWIGIILSQTIHIHCCSWFAYGENASILITIIGWWSFCRRLWFLCDVLIFMSLKKDCALSQEPCSSVALLGFLYEENQGWNSPSPNCCNNWIIKNKKKDWALNNSFNSSMFVGSVGCLCNVCSLVLDKFGVTSLLN